MTDRRDVKRPSMTLPKTIDSKKVVLFLGAGFSVNCKNMIGSSFPTTAGIEDHFRSELDQSDPRYKLQDLSDALRRRNFNFAKYLTEQFTCSAGTPAIEAITKYEWMRIYTTNYDDSYELERRRHGKPIDSYSYKSEYPKKLSQSAIVHLHGYVRDINEAESISREIVLDGASYASTDFKKTQWWKQYQRDINNAQYIIFIGYSLNDVAIKKLLVSDPDLVPKVFFIVHDGIPSLHKETLEEYGCVETTGLNGFVDFMEESYEPANISNINVHSLRSLRYFETNKDQKTYQKASIVEVFDLLSKGKVNRYRIADPIASKNYAAPRGSEIDQCVRGLTGGKNVLVSAWLGNGKSVFSLLLASKLSADGFDCFFYNPRYETNDEEVQAIAVLEKPIIFFESLPEDHLVNRLSADYQNIRLVLLLRSGFLELNYDKISEMLRQNYAVVDINYLSDQDRSEVKSIAKNAALSISVEAHDTRYMRDFVLSSFRNETVKNSIVEVFENEFINAKFKQIVLLVVLYSLYNIPANMSIVRDIVDDDPFDCFIGGSDSIQEFFDASGGGISLRSSIVAQFLIDEFFSSYEVVNSISKLIDKYSDVSADHRIESEAGTLMRFSRVSDVLREKDDAIEQIERMYETLRADQRISYHPLFWLQFSFVFDEGRLDIAEECIETAFRAAKELPKFQTYQLDTQALRIYLRAELSYTGATIPRLSKILQKIETCKAMVGNVKHIHHVIKVLDMLPKFIQVKANVFTRSEASAIRQHLFDLSERMAQIDDDSRARFGVDAVRSALIASRVNLDGAVLSPISDHPGST